MARAAHPNKDTEEQLKLLEYWGWTVVSSREGFSLACQVGKEGACIKITRSDTARSVKRLMTTHKTQHRDSFP